MKYDIHPSDVSVLVLEFTDDVTTAKIDSYRKESELWQSAIDDSIKKVKIDISQIKQIDIAGREYLHSLRDDLKKMERESEFTGGSDKLMKFIKNKHIQVQKKNSKRKHQRIPISDLFTLFILVPVITKNKVKIIDISESGLKFNFPKTNDFEPGEIVTCHLHVNEKLYLFVKLKVIRVDEDGVAGEYSELSKRGIEAIYSLLNFLRIATEDYHIEV